MAPLPVPEIWNPIAPIQNNWAKIEPWQKGYLGIIGGVSTIFGAAAAIALIVDHGGKLPKWPFTSDRWNPKPTVDKKEDEVSDDQLVEDELAEVVGSLGKRSLDDEELEWFDNDVLNDAIAEYGKIFNRESMSFKLAT
jgi:hypothetical protein